MLNPITIKKRYIKEEASTIKGNKVTGEIKKIKIITIIR